MTHPKTCHGAAAYHERLVFNQRHRSHHRSGVRFGHEVVQGFLIDVQPIDLILCVEDEPDKLLAIARKLARIGREDFVPDFSAILALSTESDSEKIHEVLAEVD